MAEIDKQPPAIHLALVGLPEKLHLRKVLTDYLVEFAAFEGVIPDRNPDGDVPYRFFDDYWREPGRIPLAVRLGKQIIGFCLLRDTGARWQIAEFYVVPAYRRTGAGERAVSLIKEYCRNHGRHRFLEASTQAFNPVARAFWSSQGFVTVAVAGGEQENLFDLGSPTEPRSLDPDVPGLTRHQLD
jgi:predicted acetyltransferase